MKFKKFNKLTGEVDMMHELMLSSSYTAGALQNPRVA